MDEAFIIMQIGDPDLDRVCDDVIVPAIQSAGLIPRRVDRDNAGDLLKAEIIDFLERSQIIVADLTNERPNCYLEVGYAMGLGKKPNLILMAREDHHHRSPSYRPDGPRVHFDLEGYDLLLWDPSNLDAFREALEQRIRRRLAIVQPAPVGVQREQTSAPPLVDQEWVDANRERALAGLEALGRSASFEAVVAIAPKGSWRQPTLLGAVTEAQVHTFGWPIGIVLDRAGERPTPTADGVRAEVAIRGSNRGPLDRTSYDYWHVRQTGDYYVLTDLFEDQRSDGVIFFDTRIIRTTELLLFLARLYSRLEVPDSTRVSIAITHRGLADRKLASANPRRGTVHSRTSAEDSVQSCVNTSVGELQSNLTEYVKQLVGPLFILFDFFELGDQIYSELVDNFVEGRLA